MKYNKDDQQIINGWVTSVGAPYLVDTELVEYKSGQLLEIAKSDEDSLLAWDEWQWLQMMMGMEISLEMSIRIVGMLYENDIETLELSTDNSKEYEKQMNAQRRMI